MERIAKRFAWVTVLALAGTVLSVPPLFAGNSRGGHNQEDRDRDRDRGRDHDRNHDRDRGRDGMNDRQRATAVSQRNDDRGRDGQGDRHHHDDGRNHH